MAVSEKRAQLQLHPATTRRPTAHRECSPNHLALSSVPPGLRHFERVLQEKMLLTASNDHGNGGLRGGRETESHRPRPTAPKFRRRAERSSPHPKPPTKGDTQMATRRARAVMLVRPAVGHIFADQGRVAFPSTYTKQSIIKGGVTPRRVWPEVLQ